MVEPKPATVSAPIPHPDPPPQAGEGRRGPYAPPQAGEGRRGPYAPPQAGEGRRRPGAAPQAGEGRRGPYAPPQAGEGTTGRRANAALASWLSLIPGLGQLYNRQPRKALIFFVGVLGVFFVTLNIPGSTGELLAWWKPRGSIMVMLSLLVQILSLLLFMTTFFLALAFWYDALHDARWTAQEINSERKLGGRWWLFHR